MNIKIGQKLNKLTIINIENDKYTYQCDCKDKTIKTTYKSNLIKLKSCGCLSSININLINQKFNFLTVKYLFEINKQKKIWTCKCDCGNYKNISTSDLKFNRVKSCGLCNLLNIRKYDINQSAAREIYNLNYSEMTFEEFIKLSQQNCFYCAIPPYNIRKGQRHNNDFIYNGIDRINSNKDHIINNIVTCCKQCNWAKRNMPYINFKNHIQKLIIFAINKKEIKENISLDILKNLKIKNCISRVYSKNYNDGNLTLEQFYKLSQLNCYYCNSNPNNMFISRNKEKFIFKYNGLDRIDSNSLHNYENVVTCCKTCNYAKSNYSLEEFYYWIDRLRVNKFWDKIIDNKINNGICDIVLT